MVLDLTGGAEGERPDGYPEVGGRGARGALRARAASPGEPLHRPLVGRAGPAHATGICLWII